jgi:OmpR family response regulator RpaB
VSSYIAKILIIDQETAIFEILEQRLTHIGYEVTFVSDGQKALSSFYYEQPDLVILDILMLNSDGYEICRKLREYSSVPIIILTALGTIKERIKGFEVGADDYIIKPFSPKELEVRIDSVLRRVQVNLNISPEIPQNSYQAGSIQINFLKKEVIKHQNRIKLTKIEFLLLELLVKNRGKVVSRLTILDNIWGYTPQRYGDVRLIDVHISRLRLKLEENPRKPELILTTRGIGYMFQVS